MASVVFLVYDDERGLHLDYQKWLEVLAPHASVSQYQHNRTGEDNADAHLKRQMMGREVAVAIADGRLDFGPWEQIFYGEFDGGAESGFWSRLSESNGLARLHGRTLPTVA